LVLKVAQKNLDRVRAARKAAKTRIANALAKKSAKGKNIIFRKQHGKTVPIHISPKSNRVTHIQARKGASLKIVPKNLKPKAVSLKEHGYSHVHGEVSRHNALEKVVKKEGYARALRLLQTQTFVDKDNKDHIRIYRDDMAWVRGKYAPAPKPYEPKKPKDLGKKHWTFASQSAPGRKYYVTMSKNGNLQCNCPGFIFKRGREARTCRHVREVAEKTGYKVAA